MIHVWGLAARMNAAVHVRIEDHDRERCRPEYEAGILEDLDWLGYRPDFPAVRQSERDAIYREAVDALVAQGLVALPLAGVSIRDLLRAAPENAPARAPV